MQHKIKLMLEGCKNNKEEIEKEKEKWVAKYKKNSLSLILKFKLKLSSLGLFITVQKKFVIHSIELMKEKITRRYTEYHNLLKR